MLPVTTGIGRRTTILLTGALVSALLSGCSSPQGEEGDQPAGAKAITVIAPDSRKPGPALEGDDLAGKQLSSADYSGQALVVNLWGPWCGPCRSEAPMLKTVSDRYAAQDVQFLDIVVDSDSAGAARFNSRFKIGYPTFADQGGRLEVGFAKSLPAQAVPTTWIIDAHGRVAVRIVVPHLSESTLTGLIDDVLAEPT